MIRELALSLTFIAAATAQAAAGDAQAGRRIALRWCDGCHGSAEANRASDGAPSLLAIAQDKSKTPEHLRAWLTAPHPPMPNLNLSRSEIDDIMAYLESLSRR